MLTYDDVVAQATRTVEADLTLYEGVLTTGDAFTLRYRGGVAAFRNETVKLNVLRPLLTGPAELSWDQFKPLVIDLFEEADLLEEAREAQAIDLVRDLMSECFGFPVAQEAIEDLRDAAPEDWNEGHEHGFQDTVVREALMSEFSKLTIGIPSFTYGEARDKNVDMDAYFETVRATHDGKYGEQPLPTWMTYRDRA